MNSPGRAGANSQASKLFDGQTSLPDDGAQCASGEILSGMVRHDGASVCGRMIPEFVAALRLAVKDKPGFAELPNDVRGAERWEARHVSMGTGMVTSSFARGRLPIMRLLGRGSLCAMHDSMIFRAPLATILKMLTISTLSVAPVPRRTGRPNKNPLDVALRGFGRACG